jgi:hypothetical protein
MSRLSNGRGDVSKMNRNFFHFTKKMFYYQGNEKMCILFDFRKKLISDLSFKELHAIESTFENLQTDEIINYICSYADKKLEFFIYDVNLFITPKIKNLSIKGFLIILESNLRIIANLNEGDAVGNILFN